MNRREFIGLRQKDRFAKTPSHPQEGWADALLAGLAFVVLCGMLLAFLWVG